MAPTDRKSQTTKDLAKPWAALGLRLGSNEETSEEAEEETPQAHSARTTVLLDDSPLKAKLQPWNHICIREYVASMRRDDVACWENEEASRKKREEMEREAGGGVDGGVEVQAGTYDADSIAEGEEGKNAVGEVEEQKKRKRTKKKKKNKVALLSEDTSSSDSVPTDHETPHELRPIYDPTLLAVIGVLDALKHESNVAGWIRGGRLRARAAAGDKENRVKSDNLVPLSPLPSILSAPYDDARDTDGHVKRRRIEPSGTSVESAIDVDWLEEEGEKGGSCEEVELGQWYEDASVMSYWFKRGLKALEELGEEVVSGVAI